MGDESQNLETAEFRGYVTAKLEEISAKFSGFNVAITDLQKQVTELRETKIRMIGYLLGAATGGGILTVTVTKLLTALSVF